MQSFKTNSAKDVRFLLGKTMRRDVPGHGVPGAVKSDHFGGFAGKESRIGWHAGFYDRHILTSGQRAACLNYINCNAINHGLVREPHHWPWTSLHYEHLLDPMEMWLE